MSTKLPLERVPVVYQHVRTLLQLFFGQKNALPMTVTKFLRGKVRELSFPDLDPSIAREIAFASFAAIRGNFSVRTPKQQITGVPINTKFSRIKSTKIKMFAIIY